MKFNIQAILVIGFSVFGLSHAAPDPIHSELHRGRNVVRHDVVPTPAHPLVDTTVQVRHRELIGSELEETPYARTHIHAEEINKVPIVETRVPHPNPYRKPSRFAMP